MNNCCPYHSLPLFLVQRDAEVTNAQLGAAREEKAELHHQARAQSLAGLHTANVIFVTTDTYRYQHLRCVGLYVTRKSYMLP